MVQDATKRNVRENPGEGVTKSSEYIPFGGKIRLFANRTQQPSQSLKIEESQNWGNTKKFQKLFFKLTC